jgi:predicted DNA binding CopG/RHH family protein
MIMKKPAQLGENLLSIRPRKGEAKPQSEEQAASPAARSEATDTKKMAPDTNKAAPRRRRRLSDKKMQLNLRVSEKSLERFTKLADDEGLIFGDLFEKMLGTYEKKK